MRLQNNARFWTLHRGDWVKLTLKPKQKLRLRSHESSDGCEWSLTDTMFCHRGDDVYWAIVKRGHCTDVGTYTEVEEYSCPLSELKDVYPDEGIPLPRWQQLSY